MPVINFKEVKALIVGAGVMGERYALAQKLEPNSETFLFDVDDNKAHLVATRVGAQVATSFEESLDWANLVYICTPDHLHTEIAAAAIKQGKTTFCEKPLSTKLEDALYLQELASDRKTSFFVGQLLRLTPVFQKIKEAIVNKEVGKLLSVRSTYLHNMASYLQPGNWREDQNFLYGGGAHPIDLLSWIADEPIVEVQAQTGTKVFTNYSHPEDYQILLKFKSGLLGHVWLNANLNLPTHKTDLEIYGEKGTIISDSSSQVLKTFYNKDKDFKLEEYPKEFSIPIVVRILNNIVKGETDNYSPLLDINEAVSLIKVLDTVERSMQSRKPVYI